MCCVFVCVSFSWQVGKSDCEFKACEITGLMPKEHSVSTVYPFPHLYTFSSIPLYYLHISVKVSVSLNSLFVHFSEILILIL